MPTISTIRGKANKKHTHTRRAGWRQRSPRDPLPEDGDSLQHGTSFPDSFNFCGCVLGPSPRIFGIYACARGLVDCALRSVEPSLTHSFRVPIRVHCIGGQWVVTSPQLYLANLQTGMKEMKTLSLFSSVVLLRTRWPDYR